jgi:hypothetical protein
VVVLQSWAAWPDLMYLATESKCGSDVSDNLYQLACAVAYSALAAHSLGCSVCRCYGLCYGCCSGAILLALVIFSMMTYASKKYPVGSIGAVWENLQVTCHI